MDCGEEIEVVRLKLSGKMIIRTVKAVHEEAITVERAVKVYMA